MAGVTGARGGTRGGDRPVLARVTEVEGQAPVFGQRHRGLRKVSLRLHATPPPQSPPCWLPSLRLALSFPFVVYVIINIINIINIIHINIIIIHNHIIIMTVLIIIINVIIFMNTPLSLILLSLSLYSPFYNYHNHYVRHHELRTCTEVINQPI